MGDPSFELRAMFNQFNETTPSLVVPDLLAESLPTFERFEAGGFRSSGVRSIGNQTLRDETISTYGFALPCSEAISACLARSPIVEVGAGCAFWAHLIAKAGGDVIATDKSPISRPARDDLPGWPWHPVVQMEAFDAVRFHPDRTVLMIWPSLGRPWAADVLEAMVPGQVLIHVGEIGGATADERFAETLHGHGFEEIDRIWIPNWPGMHDDMTIVRKNPSDRP